MAMQTFVNLLVKDLAKATEFSTQSAFRSTLSSPTRTPAMDAGWTHEEGE